MSAKCPTADMAHGIAAKRKSRPKAAYQFKPNDLAIRRPSKRRRAVWPPPSPREAVSSAVVVGDNWSETFPALSVEPHHLQLPD